MTSFARNTIYVLALGLVFSLAIAFPPNSAVTEAYLNCPGRLDVQFSDMLACSKELSAATACTCSRPPSLLSSAYWIVLPIAIGLIAAFVFRAGPVVAVPLLIGSILAFGGVTLALLNALDRIDNEGFLFSLISLVPFSGISVIGYGCVSVGRYFWRRSARAT